MKNIMNMIPNIIYIIIKESNVDKNKPFSIHKSYRIYLDTYHNSKVPIFYYIGIGSANHSQSFPNPNNRHEYSDYVGNLPYKKVLTLIDPFTKIPLDGSGIALVCNVDEKTFSKYTFDNSDIYVIKHNI